MSPARDEFARLFSLSVQQCLGGRRHAGLRLASDAGRDAVIAGLGLVEMLELCRTLLVQAPNGAESSDVARSVQGVFDCLAESVQAFESDQLQEALSRLQDLEKQFHTQNDALTAARDSIEKERARYQALFDLAPDAYLISGFEGAIEEANAAAAALLRAPQRLLPGRSVFEFVDEPDQENLRDRLHQLHAGRLERLDEWEIGLKLTRGSCLPAAITIVADRSAPATARLRWLIRDISERKRSEKERARWLLSRATASATRRFEFLAEASALLAASSEIDVSLTSVAHLAAFFFQAWCFISTEGPVALHGTAVAAWQSRLEPLSAQLREHSLFGRTPTSEWEHIFTMRKELPSLSAEWFRQASDGPEHARLLRETGARGVTILPLRVRGHLLGLLAILRTEESRSYRAADRAVEESLAHRCALALDNARLCRELMSQRDQAERASRAKDEFLAILGHELRNPLTPVVGWTRILKTETSIASNPVLAEGVRAMEKSIGILLRLVSECSDLAKIAEGKILIQRRTVDLNQIAISAVESIRPVALDRQLHVQIDAPSVAILGDAMRLDQVLSNLLTNALKYSGPGASIRVHVTRDTNHAEIAVADTGIGINAAYLEEIFEPFRQGSDAWLTSQSGLGLGLAIARRIVEAHGGRIWAESHGLGRGSTFRVRVPLAPDARVETAPVHSEPSQPNATRRLRVLLIEDSEDVLFLLKTDLERIGHTVFTTTDARAAVPLAIAERPEIIISDIRMPFLDGYELMRRLRQTPELKETPAIALTGFGARREMDAALAAGFNACLSKPAEPEEIAALLTRLALQPEQHSAIEAS